MKVIHWSLPCLVVVSALAASAGAQTYPAKPVRYVVPMSAGSGADTIGRIVVGGLSAGARTAGDRR